MVQDASNLALEGVVKAFSSAHPDAGVVSFPFATIQRGFVSNYGQLGFVNAVSGCASDLAITQYSTGNLFNLADPTFTSEGAKVGNATTAHIPRPLSIYLPTTSSQISMTNRYSLLLWRAADESASVRAGHPVAVTLPGAEAEQAGKRPVRSERPAERPQDHRRLHRAPQEHHCL